MVAVSKSGPTKQSLASRMERRKSRGSLVASSKLYGMNSRIMLEWPSNQPGMRARFVRDPRNGGRASRGVIAREGTGAAGSILNARDILDIQSVERVTPPSFYDVSVQSQRRPQPQG